MSEIKPVARFDLGYSFYGYAEMQTSETGDYVEFAALEALQEELEDEKQKGAALWKNVESRCKEIDALQAENTKLKEESQNYENAVRIVQEWSGQLTLANGELRNETAAQAKRIAELEAPLNPYERVDLQGKLYITGLQNQIEALRKQVEALRHTAPTSIGFCSRSGGCVCGGDLPRVRESCSSWVKSAQKGTE